MASTPICRKLRILTGSRVILLGAPAGFAAALGPLPPDAVLATRLSGTADVVVAFVVTRQAAIRKAGALRKASQAGAVIWVAYPKLTSDRAGELSRDILWKALAPLGLRPVSQIAVDDTWTAMRFKAG